MPPRSALLLVGLQNEFLDPHVGHCLMTPPEPDKPTFVDNIKTFIPHFRARGGDVIWVRSEFKQPRDYSDPSNDEVVLLVDSDEEDELGEERVETHAPLPPPSPAVPPKRNSRARRKKKGGKGPAATGTTGEGSSTAKPTAQEEEPRPPSQLRTDAFLAVESDGLPPCAPDTLGCEFFPSLLPIIQSPPDRILIKTWFSAFKDTTLLETLRGRFITELYLCGGITNICILATAADAAKHGLEVTILTDCMGYRSKLARDRAMRVMIDDFAVEEVRSTILAKSWERTRARAKGNASESSSSKDSGSLGMNVGATSIPKEDLAKMVEGLKLSPLQNIRRVGEARPKVDGNLETDSDGSPGTDDSKTGEGVQKVDEGVREGDEKKTDELDLRLEALSLGGDALQSPASGESSRPATAGSSGMPSPSPPAKQQPVNRKPRMASRSKRFDSKAPVLGQGDVLGEGDSEIFTNLLPADLAEVAFERLKDEVAWRTMYHRGGEVPRLVAVEGEIGDDGSFPIYRHPADESPPLFPFSDTVSLIRECVQKALKHPVNHVLIQHYRDGIDYISEHSDKTLDIARGSKIVNVSLGAQRTMILRTKKDIAKSNDPKRSAQRIPLPHNSMFVLGLETNRKWLHGIRQDKRADTLKKPEEYAYNGERISLTFRHISTFLTPDEQEIYGQGATSKSKSSARKVINGETPEAEKLLEAFGSENHQSDFDWDATYGAGSDVLHLKEQLPKLFFLSDADGGGDVDTWRVKLCLHEKGIRVTPHELSSNDTASSSFLLLSPRGTTPVLTDVDRDKTVIRESLAIMQYLEMFYPPPFPNRWLLPSLADERSAFALVLQRMHESQHLAEILSRRNPQSQEDSPEIVRELNIWDDYVRRSGGYVATRDDASLADLAAYPPIAKFLEREGWKLSPRWQNLAAWIAVMDARESVKATRPSG